MIIPERKSDHSVQQILTYITGELQVGECTCCDCCDKDNPTKCSAVEEIGAVLITETGSERLAAQEALKNLLLGTSHPNKLRCTALYCLKLDPKTISADMRDTIARFEKNPDNSHIISAAKGFMK